MVRYPKTKPNRSECPYLYARQAAIVELFSAELICWELLPPSGIQGTAKEYNYFVFLNVRMCQMPF